MAQPRHQLIDIQKTPYYHVMSRCVRRAYLCGYDKVNARSYEHRRKWIEERIRLLSSLFAIDICAYAVMRNHYHIVVKICPDKSFDWSQDEVIRRWSCLFCAPVKTDHFGSINRTDGQSEKEILRKVETCRARLANLSWFMRCLNEPLARKANREDDVTGHFWEARFKSQALPSDAALLACMAYVDLNPVRAYEASTPESSNYTSFKERIINSFDLAVVAKQHLEDGSMRSNPGTAAPLAPFQTPGRSQVDELPVTFNEYITLLDYTYRTNAESKKKLAPDKLSAMFNRVKIRPEMWCRHANNFEETYNRRWKHNDGASCARPTRAH